MLLKISKDTCGSSIRAVITVGQNFLRQDSLFHIGNHKFLLPFHKAMVRAHLECNEDLVSIPSEMIYLGQAERLVPRTLKGQIRIY